MTKNERRSSRSEASRIVTETLCFKILKIMAREFFRCMTTPASYMVTTPSIYLSHRGRVTVNAEAEQVIANSYDGRRKEYDGWQQEVSQDAFACRLIVFTVILVLTSYTISISSLLQHLPRSNSIEVLQSPIQLPIRKARKK
jgi:hypothetical protein